MGNKRLIHAVAGSGKTTTLIGKIDPTKKNLVITYTSENQNHLKRKLIDKFGRIPEYTHVFGVFEFLYQFCLIPYLGKRLNGVNFNYQQQNFGDKTTIDNSKRAIVNQLSNSLINGNVVYGGKSYKCKFDYLKRMDKFFDSVYIDECQDFASDDFDWMMSLSQLEAEVLLVGDYYQKTFQTSSRGNKGKGTHSTYENWKSAIEKAGFEIDEYSLMKSYRCPKTICKYITENFNIQIEGIEELSVQGTIRELETQEEIESVMNDDGIMKLFYQNSKKYQCRSMNWGESKGTEYEKICVVLNQSTYKHYKANTLNQLPEQTKAKLYVACTRTRGDLYFVEESKVKGYIK